MIIGIDLGTTNSLVGVWRDGRVQLIGNALGEMMTPSAVSVDDDGRILVGRAARERLPRHPHRSVAAFKRYMGTERQFKIGGLEFRAEELSALVLQSLRADAEASLGHPVSEAVITVPAYFNDAQRKATKAAAEIAGLKVERLLNEPTAAAMAYGLQEGEGDRRIIVLDLGGGTFDVSLLEMFDGVMEVRASAGDNFLGGEDFVDVIMQGFLDANGLTGTTDPDFLSLLRHQAEMAKRAVSDAQSFALELRQGGQSFDWVLTRARFEELSKPLLQRIRTPIERAFRDAAIDPDRITHVVLAGGATRMPMVRQQIARLFQRFPIVNIDPDQVVAHGAAIQAGLKMRDAALEEFVMTDVAPFSLGVETGSRTQGMRINGLFAPIIERNTVIPASRSRRFVTSRDRQTELTSGIYQGEARMVADNIKLGEITVPVPPGPAGEQAIEVRFSYDVSGLLEVDVTVEQTGVTAHLRIEGNPGVLTPEEIAARSAGLAKLKIHPREEAENRTVLARAERLYEECLGETREALGRWIATFRVIIERQDGRQIQACRSDLIKLMETVEKSAFS
jgi:molecular chaperone HscC